MNENSNRALAPELRERHYVLHSPKHPRLWVAFSPNKVADYRRKFGDNFCLVITGDPIRPDDFYAIPWSAVSGLFTDANRLGVRQKSGSLSYRWQIYRDGRTDYFQMEFSPTDPRERPRFNAAQWYGNLSVLGLPPKPTTDKSDGEDLDDDLSATEGREILALHRRRERDQTLARRAKELRLKTHGSLSCDVCGFDFAAAYGTLGEGFIEAHHTVPLRDLTKETRTTIRHLALVCGNCHRMLHRGQVWPTVDQLRLLVQDRERSK